MQAMHGKKLSFMKLQIHGTCFRLNSLWVYELFEAALVHFHSLGSSAHLLLSRIKYSLRVKHSFATVSFHFIFSVLPLFNLFASFSLGLHGSLPCTVSYLYQMWHFVNWLVYTKTVDYCPIVF